MIVAISV